MSRLRIALVANNIHFRGGMERYCAELVRHLCDDHDLHLFSREVDDVPFEKVTIHPIRTVRKPMALLFTQFYMETSRQVSMKDFDIVHTIGGITAHQNVVTAQYCQYAWGDAIQREAGASEGINSYHQFMWKFTGYFEKKAMTSPETAVISACSQRTKDDLQKFYGCDPRKISVIYNGVDPVRFSPANRKHREEIRRKYGLADNAVVVLFVGEYRRKGLATVIRALGLINDPRVFLLAIGKGDRAFYGSVAEKAGIADRVILADPEKQVERIFGAADLFAFPTFYEPFGMVITEAMASGLPVITSRTAGAAEVIDDGESGFIVERPGDAQEFSEKLAPLLRDEELRRHIGTNAVAAASPHDWKRVADETLRLYHSIGSSPVPAGRL